VSAECVKNHAGFSLFGEQFGPFEKGKNYRLKLFLAMPFIESNILKIHSSEKCDNVDVQRYALAERDTQQLIQQETNYFLNKIKEFKKFMEKDILDDLKPRRDLENFNSYLMNIIDHRLLKILRLTKTDLSLDDERRLTNSEQVLFKHIHELVNTWRNFYLMVNNIKNNS
jgi:hypothetical protein